MSVIIVLLYVWLMTLVKKKKGLHGRCFFYFSFLEVHLQGCFRKKTNVIILQTLNVPVVIIKVLEDHLENFLFQFHMHLDIVLA